MQLISKPENIYPVVPLRDGIIFPSTENVLLFGRSKSIQAINASLNSNKKIVMLMQKNPQTDDPGPDDMYVIGIVGTVVRVFKGDKGELSGLIRGEKRIKVVQYTRQSPYLEVKVEELPEIIEENEEIQALVKHISKELKRAINLGKGVDVVYLMNLMGDTAPQQYSEQIAMILDLKGTERQDLVEELSLYKRLQKESNYISKEVKVLEIEYNIHKKTQEKLEKGVKDAVLREKLKTIEKELGGETTEDKDIKLFKAKISKLNMPVDIEKKILKEVNRLAQMSPYNPETSYIRTYLEWITDMPWNFESKANFDLKKAERILNEDHYGLKKIKERILEYLAVIKLKKQNGKSFLKTLKSKKDFKQPTILCFVGPPGVGKTSIGKSIARALNRKFVKMSLGGIRDEAEIRGHRRTYVGALPGRIIQGIRQAETKNPVFMLDEIDKIGADYRGDPSSALLEALDPEQNHSFSDHYLEVPFDLSEVMFITTANILDTIPSALRDRLEIIVFPGYTDDEKYHIARDFLINKQLIAHGLNQKQTDFTDASIKLIIHRYTREAGVRELERQIAAVYRKIARLIVEKKKYAKAINEKDIAKYLGPYKYSDTLVEKENMVGMSTGLAYTQAGGDILFIEVAVMPGKGNLLLTGHLGEVMKESCQAALSYIRSRWQMFKMKQDFYSKIDIHIHVPEGAVPKDGPSAGVAITTAMVSALTKMPVSKTVAMTGEITLRGRVMEIGGVKEKVIAAHRAGIKSVILPKENKRDLEDIPKYVLSDLNFIYVDHMDQVLKKALVHNNKKLL